MPLRPANFQNHISLFINKSPSTRSTQSICDQSSYTFFCLLPRAYSNAPPWPIFKKSTNNAGKTSKHTHSKSAKPSHTHVDKHKIPHYVQRDSNLDSDVDLQHRARVMGNIGMGDANERGKRFKDPKTQDQIEGAKVGLETGKKQSDNKRSE